MRAACARRGSTILTVQDLIRTAQRRLTTFVSRLGADVRGNVAMMFAFAAPVLIMMTLGAVDIHRISTIKANVQDALDAATLAAARSSYTTEADLTRVGLATLKANLAAYPGVVLNEGETRFLVNDQDVVIADARVDVKTLVANIVMPPYGKLLDDTLPVSSHAEVNRSSRDLEVALVLDITGSMDNGKIDALKSAALELVDIVVQPTQTPYYSKMAIIPYSAGVNMGTAYVTGARGAPTGSTRITKAGWIWSGASSKAISGITRASPGVVTAYDHGLQTGDFVWINDVAGMRQINDQAYRVKRLSSSTLSLEYRYGSNWYDLKTRWEDGYSSYSSGGKVTRCQREDCSVIVTSVNHGLQSGDGVYITGVSGMTGINNRAFWVTRIDADNYSIGANGATWGTYSSGGDSWCGRYGCTWRVFNSMTGGMRAFKATTCVTERTGAQAYTDAAPSNRVGFLYGLVDSNGNDASACPSNQIQPLTSTKGTLTDLIDDLTIGGGTAGQIGTAWGWYALSPEFNSLWAGSGAGAYDPELLKAVILMTDGEFNTPYASGVVARDAGVNSGSNSYKIDQNATNGNPFDQALSLCTAMKKKGIVVYTVGFQVPSDGAAARLMTGCATTTEHAYLPTSGTDLSQAFRDIGRDITRLRISK